MNESAPKTSESTTEDVEILFEQVNELLNQLDEEAIYKLLEKELERADASNQMSRFIPIEDIIIDTETLNSYGSYGEGEIQIHALTFERSKALSAATIANKIYKKLNNEISWYIDQCEETGDQNIRRVLLNQIDELMSQIDALETVYESGELADIALRLKLLHTVIHEELHALTDQGTSTHTDSGKNIEVKKVGFRTRAEGYQYHGTGRGKEFEFFDSDTGVGINEAVTQLKALELAKEYWRQNPILEKDPSMASDLLVETMVGYTDEMMMAEYYIALISSLSGIEEERVLNGLFNEYTQGNDHLPTEFKDLILSEMVAAENNESAERFAEKVTDVLRTALAKKFEESKVYYFQAMKELITTLNPETQAKIDQKFSALQTKYADCWSEEQLAELADAA
jgi:hypothetical protein